MFDESCSRRIDRGVEIETIKVIDLFSKEGTITSINGQQIYKYNIIR